MSRSSVLNKKKIRFGEIDVTGKPVWLVTNFGQHLFSVWCNKLLSLIKDVSQQRLAFIKLQEVFCLIIVETMSDFNRDLCACVLGNGTTWYKINAAKSAWSISDALPKLEPLSAAAFVTFWVSSLDECLLCFSGKAFVSSLYGSF